MGGQGEPHMGGLPAWAASRFCCFYLRTTGTRGREVGNEAKALPEDRSHATLQVMVRSLNSILNMK